MLNEFNKMRAQNNMYACILTIMNQGFENVSHTKVVFEQELASNFENCDIICYKLTYLVYLCKVGKTNFYPPHTKVNLILNAFSASVRLHACLHILHAYVCY